jgi:hypothetical protein
MKKIISYLRNIFSFNSTEEIVTENETKDVINLSTTFVTNEVLKVEELAKIEKAVEEVAKVEEVKPITVNEVKPKSTYRRPKKKNSTKK